MKLRDLQWPALAGLLLCLLSGLAVVYALYRILEFIGRLWS
jgi:Tfp pilus assembly protein PilO